MIWVLCGKDATEIREHVEATLHKADAVAFSDTAYFLYLKAKTVEEAVEELNLGGWDDDRYGLMLPAEVYGYVSKEFNDQVQPLLKRGSGEVIS